MKFWHDYIDRKPFLAASWLRLAMVNLTGEVMP